ncbi:hypothetical protein AAFF_G00168760 [Aldrovandia affinis]|uniref:Coiled-coil domain-containing protein 172 n=1 Tax=Aldrovandia affinis TaxID=143900 RepID=A0AAD7W7T3_9TELE|nr:hypothetical protein AAFF_G00168760 [Aldrovandia affinis]
MSLDTLFHQILLTEQKVSEKTRLLNDVKALIIKHQLQIKTTTEEITRAKNQLEEKSRVLFESELQVDQLKKCVDGREKQRDELLTQKNRLTETSEEIQRRTEEERDRFMEEIVSFNSEFGLLRNREAVEESRARAEIQALQREEDSLNKEMECMVQEHTPICCLQVERTVLQERLFQLETQARDLDTQVEEAAAVTECLRAERTTANQRPSTESVFLRLKSEVGELKEGELGNVRQALRSEIQLLKMELSQKASSGSRS